MISDKDDLFPGCSSISQTQGGKKKSNWNSSKLISHTFFFYSACHFFFPLFLFLISKGPSCCQQLQGPQWHRGPAINFLGLCGSQLKKTKSVWASWAKAFIPCFSEKVGKFSTYGILIKGTVTSMFNILSCPYRKV